MKVLCIVNHLPVRGNGADHFKSDLYSRAVAMHSTIATENKLFCLWGVTRGENLLKEDQARAVVAELGAQWVPNNSPRSMLPLVHTSGSSKVADARREKVGKLLPAALLPSLLWPNARDLRRYRKRFPEPAWHGFLYNYHSTLVKLEAICNSSDRPDIVAALHSCNTSGWFAHALHRLTGVPYIVWEHKTIYQRHRLKGRNWILTKDTLGSAAHILTVSPQLGHAMQHEVGIREPERFTHIPNPIPDNFFKPPSSKIEKAMRFAEGRTIFAAWTDWRPQKRLDVLLDAFKIVSSSHNDVCLVIAGSYSSEANAMVNERGLDGKVLVLGSLNREHVWKLAHTCDCCIVSSDAETFGLPVIEAMAAGRPVVATRCGGPEEIIDHESLGYLVESGKPSSLAKAIENIKTGISAYDRSYIAGICRERYGEAAVAERWKSVYQDLGLRD